MYLVIQMKEIIDVAFVAGITAVKEQLAVAAVAADPGATPPVVGRHSVPAVPAVEGRKEVKQESHFEVASMYLEQQVSSVAVVILEQPNTHVYALGFDDNMKPSLTRVKEKAGKRRKAPARELFELADDAGNVVGEAILS